MKNTNILEVATFAAVVLIVGFLMTMSVPTVEDTQITSTQLTDKFETKKKSYTIGADSEFKTVVLSADCEGEDLTYKWEHKGSFSNVTFDNEGFKLREPVTTKWTWVHNDDYSLYGSDGRWIEKNILHWEKLIWNGMPLNNNGKFLKVDLPSGMHVFYSEVTNDDNLLETSEMYVYVEEVATIEEDDIINPLDCDFNHSEFDCSAYTNADDCNYFMECNWKVDNPETEEDESGCK